MQLTIGQALQQAIAAHKEGKISEAENFYRAILQSQPNHPDANHNLGIIAVSLNQIEAAVPLFKSALDANSSVEQFWLSYVDALVKADRLKEARQVVKRAKKKGFDAKKLGKLLSQLKRVPESDAEAHNNLGVALQGLGKLKEAAASYNQAIALKPDYAKAHNNLGIALEALGKVKEAEASFKLAIASEPDYAEAHNNLGVALQELGRAREAAGSFNQAIALEPAYAEAHNNLGVTLEALGKFKEAEDSYNRAIAFKPDYAKAHRNVTLIKKFDSQDEQFLKMLELYHGDSMSDEERCHINFGLAKVYEDLGGFERAFTHYAEGNELRKKLLDYHINQDLELFEKIKSTAPRIKQYAVTPEESKKSVTPIFIVGMPRSGTTLVEQIVSSHPLVTSAGELNYAQLFGSAMATGCSDINHEALLNFRHNYAEQLNRLSDGKQWVIDKMPQNFLYTGLLTAAFPEAKFIHVKRCPEATCWGNFRTYFSDNSLGYAWAIDDIVTYYKCYQGLMKFWESQLDYQAYTLDYELLTDSQDSETRDLIDFIGIDWDEACLYPEDNTRIVSTASNVQVRQKVYRGSSEKWKKYEQFLNGAFASLSVQS